MRFRILGPLEVVADGGTPVPLPQLRQRALLAVLLLRVGEVVSADRLLEDLWGEHPPRTAREALQNAVSQLRKIVGPDLLVTRAPGYSLTVAPEQIDLGVFELLTAQARAVGDPAMRAEKFRAGLSLWRGPALADVAFEPFAAIELPRLNDLRLSAQHDLVDAELALGRLAELVPEVESLVAEHPFDERLRCRLALALYRTGRQAAALDACREARRALVDELGLDPTEELRTLEQQILRQNPALIAPAAPLPDAAPVRKTVTVLSVELADDRRALDQLDPERLHALLGWCAAEVREAAERHGGAVQDPRGDGSATVVFGLASAHEDDALRAVRAAVDARDALASVAVPLRTGIALATGEVFAAPDPGGGPVATGLPLRAARRLANAAPDGEILLAGSTVRLVRGAVAAELFMGMLEPNPAAFRLLSLIEGAPALERRLDSPLVGRERELAELLDLFDRVSGERRCCTATVVGEAGIGKTRLVTELAHVIGDAAAVAVGRCVSYGEGATYAPLAEAVAACGGDFDELFGNADTIGEQFLAVRRFFEKRARERPLVLVFEDVHWAEPTLLDLIDYLGERVEGAPLLVLRLSRPELLESRSVPPTGLLQLAPLATVDAEALVSAVSREVEPAVGARIVDRAEGNPLYVEHLVAYALEGGKPESLPPTLDALLAGRLDRLRAHDDALLQGAAVVGREFTRADLERLGQPGPEPLDRSLEALSANGLLRRGPAGGYRFAHVLVRDAAYARTPKLRRADLHESFAASAASGHEDSDELLGYHLEQASRYRTELGLVDDHTHRLATEAGQRLGRAGLRAWRRHDTPAAVNLLGRAVALADESDSRRLELLCELGIALRGTGEIRRAEEVLAETVTAAEAVHDARAVHRARLELANVRLVSSPGGRADEVLAAAREALPVFVAAGDDRGLFRAWRLTAYAEGAMRCRYAASTEAAARALRYGRRSGWSTAACLGDLTAALYLGPAPVPKAIARCRALLRGADLAAEANILAPSAGLEAMRGRFDEARAQITRAETIYAELGQTALAHGTGGGVRGEIELLAGRADAAEQAFRESYDALALAGDRAYLATRAAQLAEAVHLLGRDEEAMSWARLAEEAAADDDVPTQFLRRSIQARLLAHAGDGVRAEALAREAVRLAEATDALWQHAKIVLDLAEVLRVLGRPAEAAAAGARSLALYEEKASTVGEARARALLDEIAAA
jgi:DNA-binding SARP family transcriptional activator